MRDAVDKKAAKEKIGAAAVIRRMILKSLQEEDPEIAGRMLSAEVDAFIDHIAGSFSLSPAKRAKAKKAILVALGVK